jgi:CheY-like chemotaxis protein
VSTDPATRERLSILLVDDVQEFREMYARFFTFEGVGVTTAIDGREALDVARRYPPDVIVLDLSMPGMGGWEFLKRARTDTRLKEIPVVVVSAYGTAETKNEVLSAGAKAFVAKPCIPSVLLDEARRVARRRQLGRL